jgi:hypothetical protein
MGRLGLPLVRNAGRADARNAAEKATRRIDVTVLGCLLRGRRHNGRMLAQRFPDVALRSGSEERMVRPRVSIVADWPAVPLPASRRSAALCSAKPANSKDSNSAPTMGESGT